MDLQVICMLDWLALKIIPDFFENNTDLFLQFQIFFSSLQCETFLKAGNSASTASRKWIFFLGYYI